MSDNQTPLTRANYRSLMREKRQSYSARLQQSAANKLCETLINLPEVKQANNIAIYLANDGELDPLPFIKWCWQNNKKVYLPVLHPFTKGHLLFLYYDQATEMIVNKYGIPEPKLSVTSLVTFEQLDIIFTPLVAFDSQGNRLGMGGGFYDRTLSKWQHQRLLADEQNSDVSPSLLSLPSPIGLAHDFQQVDQLPCEHWDIPLPHIITPSKVHNFF